jgi:hypothetical protein
MLILCTYLEERIKTLISQSLTFQNSLMLSPPSTINYVFLPEYCSLMYLFHPFRYTLKLHHPLGISQFVCSLNGMEGWIIWIWDSQLFSIKIKLRHNSQICNTSSLEPCLKMWNTKYFCSYSSNVRISSGMKPLMSKIPRNLDLKAFNVTQVLPRYFTNLEERDADFKSLFQ